MGSAINKESLYRTRWLMAHNCLHEMTHQKTNNKKKSIDELFKKYLKELKQSEYVASLPA
jgi:hypothetical protein